MSRRRSDYRGRGRLVAPAPPRPAEPEWRREVVAEGVVPDSAWLDAIEGQGWVLTGIRVRSWPDSPGTDWVFRK